MRTSLREINDLRTRAFVLKQKSELALASPREDLVSTPRDYQEEPASQTNNIETIEEVNDEQLNDEI